MCLRPHPCGFCAKSGAKLIIFHEFAKFSTLFTLILKVPKEFYAFFVTSMKHNLLFFYLFLGHFGKLLYLCHDKL